MGDLYAYFRLDREGFCEILSWKSIELSSSDFVLEGSYLFEANGKKTESKGNILTHHYPNRFAAQRAAEKKERGRTKVWFQANHPERSALENSFPYKKCLYALTLLGVVFFFFWKGAASITSPE